MKMCVCSLAGNLSKPTKSQRVNCRHGGITAGLCSCPGTLGEISPSRLLSRIHSSHRQTLNKEKCGFYLAVCNFEHYSSVLPLLTLSCKQKVGYVEPRTSISREQAREKCSVTGLLAAVAWGRVLGLDNRLGESQSLCW